MITTAERARVAQMLKIVSSTPLWVLGYRGGKWTIRLPGDRQSVLATVPEFPNHQDVLSALMQIFGSRLAFSPEQCKGLVTGLNQLVWTTQAILRERKTPARSPVTPASA